MASSVSCPGRESNLGLDDHVLVPPSPRAPARPPAQLVEGARSEKRAAALAAADLDTRGDWGNVGNEGNFPRERGKKGKRSLSAQIIIQPGVAI